MIEWYPHVLTVSTLHPVGPQKTLNMVEFFYPEEIVAFEREFVEAQQAAYMETCVEDDEIAERMDAGRRALMLRGDDESGPYQSPMEDGMQQFHEWYRARCAPTPPDPALAQRRLRCRSSFFEATYMQALWMVLAALIFATMGVCVKIASAWFTQRRTGVLPRPDRHRLPVAAGARSRGVVAGHALPRHARLAQPDRRVLARRLVLRDRRTCRWPPR